MAEVYGGVGELIARLKKDGVDAGEGERARIVDEARKEAERIVEAARKEAQKITETAKSDAARTKAQLDTELRLAARDFVASFHQRFTSQVVRPVVGETVGSALAEDTRTFFLLQEVLVAALGQGTSIDVVVDQKKRDAFVASLSGELQKRVAAGTLVVTGEDGLSGFRLAKKGEGFVWDLSKDAIASELARLVDPALRGAFAPSSESARH